MENYLKSAGKSLKSASTNLGTLFIINIVTTILLVGINFMESKLGTKMLFLGIVGLVSIILNVVQFFIFMGNLDSAGDYLISVSKTIETKPSVNISDSVIK